MPTPQLQVYEDLEKLVCDKCLLKDLEQSGLFNHTGKLKNVKVKQNPFQLHLFCVNLHYLMCILCTFCYVNTAALEEYHSALLKYLPPPTPA